MKIHRYQGFLLSKRIRFKVSEFESKVTKTIKSIKSCMNMTNESNFMGKLFRLQMSKSKKNEVSWSYIFYEIGK